MARNVFFFLCPASHFLHLSRVLCSRFAKWKIVKCEKLFRQRFSFFLSTMPMDLRAGEVLSTTKIKIWHEFNNRLRPLPVFVRGRSRRSFAMSPSEIITSKRDETFWWQTKQECAQWLWCWWTGNYEKQTSFAYTLLAVVVSFVVVVVRLHGVKSCTLINKSKRATKDH